MRGLALVLVAALALAGCRKAPRPADTWPIPPAAQKPAWFEPGFFIHFAGVDLVKELHAEIGAGAMHAVGPYGPMFESTSFEDYQSRLENDADLQFKLESTRSAGSSLIYQLQVMPWWLSASTDGTLVCPDEPYWPRWATRAPAPEKWAEWERLVEWTVTLVTVTRGHDHVWFQLWEEPDGACYWTDSEAAYLELYARTAAAVKRANPNARIGGPGVVSASGSIGGAGRPGVRALIEHAAAQGLPLDFVSYHLFGLTPHATRNIGREVDGWLDAAGFASTPILISSYNPLESAASPYWPDPPTPSPTRRSWEYDTEIGAAYVPAMSQALAGIGRPGFHTVFQLDDFPFGGEYESEAGWGTRTPEERNGIRKAMYQAMRLQAQVPSPVIPTTVDDPRAGSDGAMGPLGALAGAEGTEVSMLLWSYVAGPVQEANAVVVEDGFPAGLATWNRESIEAFFRGTTAASAVSSDPQAQAALEAAKRVFERQLDLVQRSRSLCIEGQGLESVRLAAVVDSTHNNSYAAFRSGGVAAAIRAGQLAESPDLVVKEGDCWRLEIEPYAVVGLRFTTTAVPGSIVVRAAP